MYDGDKFAMYEVENSFHLEIGSVDLDSPPNPDGGVKIRIRGVIENPEEVGKAFDSWDRDDFE